MLSNLVILFPWLVYMAKTFASVYLPNVCLFTVMVFPRDCLFWHPTCSLTLIVYKQVISQLVEYKRVVGTQQVSDLTSKHTLWVLSVELHLQTICGKRTSSHDKFKCSVPTTCQISASVLLAACTSCGIVDFTLCLLLSDTFNMRPSFSYCL